MELNLPFITPSIPLRHPRLWKDFQTVKPQNAKLTISGLGLYRAFLNGQRIGEDYLTPGFNDYDDYLRAQSYDVTSLLRAENRLEVWLGDGWYKGRIGLDGGRENTWGDRYLLAARLTWTEAEERAVFLETDESWLAAPSPIVSSGIYDGEVRDDTRLPGDAVACVRVETEYRLTEQFSPCIRVKEVRKPVLIHTPAGEQVLDFGQNMAGIIRFVNRLPKGEQLRIQTGEVLQQGNFYRDNLRTAKSEYVYVSDGLEKEVEPLFTFFGFRYAKIEGLDSVNPDDFTALCLSSDLKETLRAETSHTGLNRLMQNSLWGQRSNFLDVPTDCPQRDERLGWTADTQVFVNTACYQMNCKDFYRKYMRDLRADQLRYYQGDLPAYSPSLKGTAMHGGAVWADAGAIIPWHVYMNYGDLELLAENYPMMRDYTESLISLDQCVGGSHLVFPAFTFGDWLAQDGFTPQSMMGGTNTAYIQGIYYLNSIRLTGKAAQTLEKTAEAERYQRLADEIRLALLDEYFAPNGSLTVDTQTGYVLALFYAVWRNKEKLLEGFRRRLEKDFFHITCGFTGAPLMLPVLLDNGLTDVAYTMLLTEEFPGWLYAVRLGATTIWERWNSLNEDGSISGTGMNSLNHYAYGSVCEAIYSRIMGLRCMAPGWKRALIAPKVDGRLKHASIRYDSPAGIWEVAWKIEEQGEMTLRATVPEGAAAHVILPYHPEAKEEDIEAGEYTWIWTPIRDLLHPFSLQSRLMEIMANQTAAEALQTCVPMFYAACQGGKTDLWLMTPEQAALMIPTAREDLQKLDEALRRVKL